MTIGSPSINPADQLQLIPADWPAPDNIKAFTTSRHSNSATVEKDKGFGSDASADSLHPYAAANMALHVGDKEQTVLANRAALARALPGDSQLHWLEQVHGCDIINVDGKRSAVAAKPPAADGWYSDAAGQALAIMSADCLPLLLCSRDGAEIAALHAGWRGVAHNILGEGVGQFNSDPAELLLWIGPGISFPHFTVGEDVREQLSRSIAADSSHCFSAPNAAGACNTDLAALVRLQARALGLAGVHGGEYCSYSDAKRFYSYRREQVTGRNATVIFRTE